MYPRHPPSMLLHNIRFLPLSLSPCSPSMASRPVPEHSLYPIVDLSNPDSISPNPILEPAPFEETVITVPGAIVHLIDDERSIELASGEFSIIRIRDGDCVVAVLARVGDDFQWPLLKDEAAVKLDSSHYFFSLRSPVDSAAGFGSDSDDEIEPIHKKDPADYVVLNYGLSFISKEEGEEEDQLQELERVLQIHTAFTAQIVAAESGGLDSTLVAEASPEERSAAYWTTLAPNVEEYGGAAAKLIAVGSGQLIRGILWCGDVTVDRLKWGNEILKKKMNSCHKEVEISPKTMRRIKRAKRVAKTTQKVADGVLNEIVKIAEYFTSSVVNTNVGRKFFSNIPGEILLASLDGFNKICDAIEVAGKNVMSTSSTITTSLVTHKYGEQAGEATKDGLDTAGHAIWTAWTVYKIRKVLNPKGAYKKTTLVKCTAEAVADEYKAKRDCSKPK